MVNEILVGSSCQIGFMLHCGTGNGRVHDVGKLETASPCNDCEIRSICYRGLSWPGVKIGAGCLFVFIFIFNAAILRRCGVTKSLQFDCCNFFFLT